MRIVIFFLAFVASARADWDPAQSKPGTYAVAVPVSDGTLRCYYGELTLDWEGLPGIWEFRPGPYNTLNEFEFMGPVRRNCDKRPALLDLAAHDGGVLNGTLNVAFTDEKIRYGGSYGSPIYYRWQRVLRVRLDLPLGIVVFHHDIFP